MYRLGNLLGGLVFAALAGICLYRLLFWFPITIGNQQVGQVASFLAFVVCTALCLIFVRNGIVSGRS
jgi:hypothetical protein